MHLGVDNLNVVRILGRMLDGNLGARPFEVVPDGDLLCLIHRMLLLRGLDTVKVTKVKGHADESMVLEGRVRDFDRLVRRLLMRLRILGEEGFLFMWLMLVGIWWEFVAGWYPVLRYLHRFFVAIARAVVNHDDGSVTAPNPLVWSAGSLPKKRRVVGAVRIFFFLPGPVGIWGGDWVSFVWVVSLLKMFGIGHILCLLVKMSAFLGTLHWPAGAVDLGVGGVSFVELLILYEPWLVRDFVLKMPFPGIEGLDVQFQCRH